MAHTIREKQKLLSRVRRIKGQVQALENALGGDHDCSAILQLIASCRGAISGLMSEVIEGHIREHVIDPDKRPTRQQTEAAEELIQVLKTYLK